MAQQRKGLCQYYCPNDLIPMPKILKWATACDGLLKWKEVTCQCQSFLDLQSSIRTGSSTWVHPWCHHTDLQMWTGYNIFLLNMLRRFFLSACLGHRAHKTWPGFSTCPLLSPLSLDSSHTSLISLSQPGQLLSLSKPPKHTISWPEVASLVTCSHISVF